MDVDIFIPCLIDQFYPETGFNMVKILEKVGVVVHYNEQQTCCGQTAFNAGYWEEARELGEKFIHQFTNDRPLVAPSASCLHMVKNQYSKLFHNTSLHIEYRNLSKKAFELSDFLVNQLNIKHIGAQFPHKVFLHLSPAAKGEYQTNKELSVLLSNVKQMEVVNTQEAKDSCGVGGGIALVHEGISTALAKQMIDKAIALEAEYIVVNEASCFMNLKSYIDKNESSMKVIHAIDLLATGWDF
jgi:L-lactate dehydrogenase complex protein LldE